MLISWVARKYNSVERSSTEAEYRALATTAAEIIWICHLLADFGISQTSPTIVLCNNISTTALTHNPVLHARTKHIELDYHFISDYNKKHHIILHHISMEFQVDDLLTKSLPIKHFKLLSNKLLSSEIPSI